MIPAIPLRFLPHSFTLVTETDTGIWGATSVSETTVSNVRIDFHDVSDGKSSALIFYDCVNSTPQNVNFTLSGGNIKRLAVRIDDREFFIEKVEYLYAEDTLHHLEITLGSERENSAAV
ncbi:MAG: minor capsid protein [Ruminococcus sp.]|jgi:hypothetical protein|nr:minor capsid protein [Ruminococcus sp.]